MTVSELREALQKLEAEGHGATDVVTEYSGKTLAGQSVTVLAVASGAYVTPHLNLQPREDGPQRAALIL